ncbi:unnamed protein product, partial [Laminaria digitata]
HYRGTTTVPYSALVSHRGDLDRVSALDLSSTGRLRCRTACSGKVWSSRGLSENILFNFEFGTLSVVEKTKPAPRKRATKSLLCETKESANVYSRSGPSIVPVE